MGIKGTMKLYIRERGQGMSARDRFNPDVLNVHRKERLLLPSEKPLAIQLRRILQAGYTDAAKIADMGRENLAMLCRFVYQPPVLPRIDPVSAIDIARQIDLTNGNIKLGG